MMDKPNLHRIKLHSERCSLSARADDIESVMAEFNVDHPIDGLVIDSLTRKRDELAARIVQIDTELAQNHGLIGIVPFGSGTSSAVVLHFSAGSGDQDVEKTRS